MLSICVGILHALIEGFLLIIESKAAKMSIKNYMIICLNARFDWLPYENILNEALLDEGSLHYVEDQSSN